jgi:DNA-binding winged helix-turn-helix (wHTH) protein
LRTSALGEKFDFSRVKPGAGTGAVNEDALNRVMMKLRRFSDPACSAIETILRVGYRLTAAMAERGGSGRSPALIRIPTPPFALDTLKLRA